MSVSSMLSGPPRAQPVSAYSPHSTTSNGASSTTATPQPPVLPPDSRASPATSEQKAQAAPRTQPGATLPVYASSLVAPAPASATKPKAAAEQPHPAGTTPASASTPAPSASAVARSSYPPLPSAFARESPYAPSPPASSGAATPQQQQQQQATAAALKNSLFPNLGSYRPAGSPTQPPSRAQQQQPQQQSQTTSAATSTGASTPYQWQAQAAQQAQQVQQQQQAQRFGQQGKAGQQGGSAAAPSLGSAARPAQPHGQQAQAAKTPSQQQSQTTRFPPSLANADPYGNARAQPGTNGQQAPSPVVTQAATAAASPAVAASQSGFKRRRSDATEQQQQSPFQRAKAVTSAAAPAAERAAVSPPPPATPVPVNAKPLFTYDEWRKAMVRPPVVEVLNDAVDAWVKEHGDAAGEGEGPRKFLGRVTYDALTPPAKLLDGEVLAQNVGGYVEVVVPTSWVLGPHPAQRTSTGKDEVRSSCSVAPVDPHPVALSYGSPSAYTGEPLPLTSPTTPLVLPSHLADLPSVRQRQVWGTDVYTDDSDVLLVLLHSGWLRVTRRERRPRAGEQGAGADAIRRARTAGEERIAVPGQKEAKAEDVPTALLVRLGVVPALVRYEGIERQGIRSRSWGNGHDGVSLRVEEVLPLDVCLSPSLSFSRALFCARAALTARHKRAGRPPSASDPCAETPRGDLRAPDRLSAPLGTRPAIVRARRRDRRRRGRAA